MMISDQRLQQALKRGGTTDIALIGDSVYGLFARVLKVAGAGGSGEKNWESAQVQAGLARVLEQSLTPEEVELFRRGRNNSRMRAPKNCPPLDYRHATGLEFLLGTIYLNGGMERLEQLFEIMEKSLLEEHKDAKA